MRRPVQKKRRRAKQTHKWAMSPQQSLRKAKRTTARAGLFGGEADCRALNYEDGAVPYWNFAYVASSAGNRNTRSFGKYRSAIRDYTGGSRLVPAAVLNLVDEAGEHIYIYGVLEGDAGERDVEHTALKRTGGSFLNPYLYSNL